VQKDEMNAVELAYSKRPLSPNFRIYTDFDVNGNAKQRDFISQKYGGGQGLLLG
jgi:hypothetical protein